MFDKKMGKIAKGEEQKKKKKKRKKKRKKKKEEEKRIETSLKSKVAKHWCLKIEN